MLRMRPSSLLILFGLLALDSFSDAVPTPPRGVPGLEFRDSSDEVTAIPGFAGTLPSKHYAGYVGVGHEKNKHMYYYLVTSEGSPQT
eukprot:224305-Rhodomonas_salina.1